MRSKSARVQLAPREIGFAEDGVFCCKCSIDLILVMVLVGQNEAYESLLPSRQILLAQIKPRSITWLILNMHNIVHRFKSSK
jgi:hypothetical protein